MPQFENIEIFGRILRSTIGVISRRTSEAYANVIIGNAISELTEKYSFLRFVKIQGTRYTEMFDVVSIQPDLNYVEPKEIGNATREFIENITRSIGKNAGYYFIKEIKEDLSYNYEKIIRDLGIDLDLLQLEFITDIKQSFRSKINNSDILKHSIKILLNLLNREIGRDASFTTLNGLVKRLSTEYNILKFCKINDIRAIQNVDIITVMPDINKLEPSKVGAAIQKILQEINNYFGEKRGFSFIEKFKNDLHSDYIVKFEEIGVNLDIIQLKKKLVIKHVLKALINILSESSSQKYAIVMVDNVLKKYKNEYDYLKLIKIDSKRFSKGIDELIISSDIESVKPSELGRGIQKIIEDISISLGEEASFNFIERFKERLGKAYILRIKELGVNLHIIELRQNLNW